MKNAGIIRFFLFGIVLVAHTGFVCAEQGDDAQGGERGVQVVVWKRAADDAPTNGKKTGGSRKSHPKPSAGPLGLGYTLFAADEEGRPTRVDPGQIFVDGDRVRLVVEPNTDGYLYIFNATDEGEPSMIFPDPRIHGGDNRVRRHALYEIPSSIGADERLKWFIFHSRQGVEHLTIVLSRTPLAGIPVGSKLVATCRTKGVCPVRPPKSTWNLVSTVVVKGDVVERKAMEFGQPLAPIEATTLASRDLSLPPDAPEPAVIRVDASAANGLLVAQFDLQHE